MLNAALTCMTVGLMVWFLNWSEMAVMPPQIYWLFTMGGMLLMVIHVITRRPTRMW